MTQDHFFPELWSDGADSELATAFAQQLAANDIEITNLGGGQSQPAGGSEASAIASPPLVQIETGGGNTSVPSEPIVAAAGGDAGSPAGDVTLSAHAPGTIQQIADYLRVGYWGRDFRWASNTISVNIASLSADQQEMAREALKAWESVAQLYFSYTTGAANITFASPATGSPSGDFTGTGSTITTATITIPDDWHVGIDPLKLKQNTVFQLYLKMVGRVLGLGQPGRYGFGPLIQPTFGVDNIFDNDSWQTSVMSGFDQVQNTYTGLNGSFTFISGPQQADIVAIQDKYGAPLVGAHPISFGRESSDTGIAHGYVTSWPHSGRSFAIYTPNGYAYLNTIDSSANQKIDMRAGHYSSIYGLTDNIFNHNTTLSIFWGGSGSDEITLAYSGTNTSSANIYSYDGNDIFWASGGMAHAIDGGADFDVYKRLGVNLNATNEAVLYRTSQSDNGWRVEVPTGTDTLKNVELAEFANAAVTLRQAKSNFNFGYASDVGSTSDVLLEGDGYVVSWLMQDGNFIGGNLWGAGVSGWNAMDTGDLDRDGDFDVIMQNGGTVVAWFASNNTNVGGRLIGAGVDGWTVKAAADIDNDGDYDVLLQNGGTIVAWTMDNGCNSGGAVVAAGIDGWDLVGTGDFDGDGDHDMLVQHAGGTKVTLFMENGRPDGGVVMGAGTAGWNVVGTGDFNGDGRADVVLQNGGTVVEWLITNGVATFGRVIGAGVDGWQVSTVGDYNGDGYADIMLQNGGTVVEWLMNGLGTGAVASGRVVATGLTADVHLVA